MQQPFVASGKDVIDGWNGRSIGGCTYHVSHPGERSDEDFPVNAITAESRRVTLFRDTEHTQGPLEPQPEFNRLAQFIPEGTLPGPMAPPLEERNLEFPYTLDLRRERQ